MKASELKSLVNDKFNELKTKTPTPQQTLNEYKIALIKSKLPREFIMLRMREADTLLDIFKKAKIPTSYTKPYYQDLLARLNSFPTTISQWKEELNSQQFPTKITQEELHFEQPSMRTIQEKLPSEQPPIKTTQAELPSRQPPIRTTHTSVPTTQQAPLLANSIFWHLDYIKMLKVCDITIETQKQFRQAFPFKKDEEYDSSTELEQNTSDKKRRLTLPEESGSSSAHTTMWSKSTPQEGENNTSEASRKRKNLEGINTVSEYHSPNKT